MFISTGLKNLQIERIQEPRQMDVLCGSKSKALSKHRGNVRLLEKIESCLDEYKKARSKQERITINRTVIHFMRIKCGSRFLKQTQDGAWTVADEQSVRDKISHAFRFVLKKSIKTKKVESEDTQLQKIKMGEVDDSSDDYTQYAARVYKRQQCILEQMLQESDEESDDDTTDSQPQKALDLSDHTDGQDHEYVSLWGKRFMEMEE